MSERAIVSRRFIPPDSGSTWSSARSVSWAKSSSSSARRRDLGPRQPEVPPVDEQVLADRQLGVERVLLGHDAEARADLRALRRRVHAQDLQRRRRVIGETHPIIRIVEVLPAPLGPRKPNDSPGATSKSMASTAVNSPNRFVRPRAWMSGASGISGIGRAWYCERRPDAT